MARWLVNHKHVQAGAEGLAELTAMARRGQVGPGDLVQPPGASDWLYAYEIPELKSEFDKNPEVYAPDDEFDKVPSRVPQFVAAAVALSITAGAGYLALEYRAQLPDQDGSLFDNVGFGEVIVTASGTGLRAEPQTGSSVVAPVEDGAAMELLAKRGAFYLVRGKNGTEGWLPVSHVLPLYLMGGGEVMDQYDPIYNPDQYLIVSNASWMELPQADKGVTVFQFQLANQSDYDMTDIVMAAKIKDSKGHELEVVEFPIQGVVPANGATMVGTHVAEDKTRTLLTRHSFDEQAGDDPDMQLEYNDGVEVEMTAEDFTEASIDIVALRAVVGEPTAAPAE